MSALGHTAILDHELSIQIQEYFCSTAETTLARHAKASSSASKMITALLQVEELELGTDMKSVNNLLNFLEKVFNGGSDFK